MARRPTVSIVGCGRAGGAIGLALKAAGYRVAAVWSRSRAGRQRAHRLLEAPVLAQAEDVAHEGDITIIAVPDDAISAMAAQIAPGVRPDSHVVHTSGGVSIETLEPVRKAGGRTGSVHPLQTLPNARTGAESLRGAAVAVTCRPENRNFLFRIARAWGGRPFLLPDESKPLYHAAAVFASNYIVTSVWAAMELMRALGVRDARPVLAPLIESTVRNILDDGPKRAITGPVARGDTQAIRRHVQALREADGFGQVPEAYRAFARLTAHLIGHDQDDGDTA